MTAKTTHRQNFLRNGLLFTTCLAVFYTASSATFFTGGGKKNKSETSLNLKSSPLTLQNGFRFKSGFTFSTTNNSLIFKGNTVTYQKGNNLYVLPVKKRVVFSKFITPKKEIK
jgi:hypothetical protein